MRRVINISAFIIGFTFMFAAALSYGSDKRSGVKLDQTINSHNTRNYDIDKRISNDSASESMADSSSESLSDASASNGDQISMNSSQFYALSLQFPQSAGCFSGAQAGGNDNNDSAFFGIHILNKSCWYDKLASHEPDIMINARLKCADRHYRNAVAYDVKGRKNRQDRCIQMKVESGKAQMEEFKRMMDEAIEESEARQDKNLEEAKDYLVERDKRIHEAGQQK